MAMQHYPGYEIGKFESDNVPCTRSQRVVEDSYKPRDCGSLEKLYNWMTTGRWACYEQFFTTTSNRKGSRKSK